MSATKQPSKAMQQKADEAERRNHMDILEHLIVAGNYHRQEQLRTKEWERRKIQSKPMRGRRPKNAPPPSQPSLYPELFRLVGRDDRYEPQPWPKRQRTQAKASPAWQCHLGDGIDPAVLANHQLSPNESASAKNEARDVGKITSGTQSTPRMDPRKAAPDVCRSLLLHCWQRAVHAASATIEVDVGRSPGAEDTGPLPSATSDAEGESSATSKEDSFSRLAAMEKCKSLGISHYPPAGTAQSVSSFPCASCSVDFNVGAQLDDHFLGPEDDKVSGCCWNLIARKQRRILAKVLHNEVKNQANNLLHLVMVTSSAHLSVKKQLQQSPKNSNMENRSLHGWEDIVECLESHLAIAKPTITAVESSSATKDTLQETLETGRDGFRTPLLLNDQIMAIVVRRLVARYGKVPR